MTVTINACTVTGVLASTNNGSRVTTLVARYPRPIHSEVMTHRVFGRNARSSRAVPVARLLAEDPFIPFHWTGNQPGMVGRPDHANMVHLDGTTMTREEAWLWAYNSARIAAKAFADAGYHKQLVNRLLEPFGFIETLITATEWYNFWKLRIADDAEPHMRDLAMAMKQVYDSMPVQELKIGEWHMPYSDSVRDASGTLYMSAARCARISYKQFDSDKLDPPKDLNDGIQLARVGHASPFDHQAMAIDSPSDGKWGRHFQGSNWHCARAYVGL